MPKCNNDNTHISHLVPLIENMQVTVKELLEWFNLVKEKGNTEVISLGGFYDIIIYPNGNFRLIPDELKTYSLEGNYYVEI